MSTLYRRGDVRLDAPTTNHSDRYWRAQARRIFAVWAEVQQIEIVHSGRRTDSRFYTRGMTHAPRAIYIIIASTGGAWGKSRVDFRPV